ncbi:uncharacterized protein Dwil_GK12526 [Drosophila willistoni]|uniref:UDP-glycosyltransferases domain-containing protein n=1 Tax=Drosophila willistoni TaxID=7260 RepID=B4N4R4_DROWI|nr:UDP-glycosyltransferase UGT4 [Drosophila willistoni]EDW79138.2 uncharacterized protein Dwil_GK12526 [Drosophila willistoni]
MRLLQLSFCLMVLFAHSISGANILTILPSVWKSHYLFGRRLLQELATSPANHSVTLISLHGEENAEVNQLPNIREIRVDGLKENWLDMGMSYEAEDMRAQSVMERFTRLIYAGTTNVDLLLGDGQVKKLLTSGERFDLLIVDLFLSDALLGMAFYYGVPTVALSPTGANSWLNNMFGNPQASSLDPSQFLAFTERMNTRQRIVNTLMSTFERLTYNFFHLISQQSVYTKHFEPLVKELPQYRELTKNLSLALINSHPGLHYPRAYLPNMLEIGGLHLLQEKDLQIPKHLESFMASSPPGGVIYMSLGADIQTAQLPSEKLAIFLDVFTHLKEFNFLIKWEKDEFLPDYQLPEHIIISNWLPQQAILAHPQMKLFISSCGQLSVWESIAGLTPILAIPILAEQEVMAKRLQLQGVSLTVNYEAIAYDALLHGIRQLTLNLTYGQNLKKLNGRLISKNFNPSARAVSQIELILNSAGADYLKSHANALNFWCAEGIDVLLIITLGFCGILTIPFLAICCILRKSYYSQAAADHAPYRATLKAVGRVHSYGDGGTCSASVSSEPLRRTRSAQSLSARSSTSSFSSTIPTSSTSTTPMDLTPPPPGTQSLINEPPLLDMYVNPRIFTTNRDS